MAAFVINVFFLSPPFRHRFNYSGRSADGFVTRFELRICRKRGELEKRKKEKENYSSLRTCGRWGKRRAAFLEMLLESSLPSDIWLPGPRLPPVVPARGRHRATEDPPSAPLATSCVVTRFLLIPGGRFWRDACAWRPTGVAFRPQLLPRFSSGSRGEKRRSKVSRVLIGS